MDIGTIAKDPFKENPGSTIDSWNQLNKLYDHLS